LPLVNGARGSVRGVRVTREQAVAFRLAAEGLAEPAPSVEAAASGWSLQDSPPGSAQLALAARVEGLAPDAVERALAERRLLATPNPRTATAVVPAGEAAAFGAALLPRDEAGLRHVLGGALQDAPELPAGEAAAAGVAAVREALDGRVLSRDNLHAELRERLPRELLPWCPGCESHHARRGLLVVAALHGALCIAGRAGRQPAFARTDQWLDGAFGAAPPPAAAGAELVRRYLSRYAPSTPALLAEWAGLAREHARGLWELVAGELVEVRVERDGARPRRAWALAADADRLAAPPAADGVRLLPPGDPLLLARDRDLLFPDPAVRKRAWKPIGSPGVVVAGGELVALWRGRKQGRALAVEVEPLVPLAEAVRAEIAEAAERAAAHRGCAGATVAFA
jgi:hypothetical protein